jgi:3-oxoacyl-[acyl-carrier-protein] synthase II
MDVLPAIQLGASAVSTRGGSTVGALWDTLQRPPEPPAELPWLPEHWRDRRLAYLLDDPSPASLGVDRKLVRTMEKQARLSLLCAKRSWEQAAASCDLHRTGLFMGLPMVDEQVPGHSALEGLKHPPSRQDWAELLLRDTPPFSGLALLNSSTLAHISGQLNLTGATAAFSPFADAGLHALIEGLLSIAEGESEGALIGAQSAKVNAAHVLQQVHLGWRGQQALGEASAFVFAQPGAQGAQVRAFGRSSAGEGDFAAALARAITLAMQRAGVCAEQIGWILGAGPAQGPLADAERMALERTQGKPWHDLPVCHAGTHTGLCGAALPLIHVLLAQHALHTGARLMRREGAWQAAALPQPHVLVFAQGPHGQACAVIVSGVVS